MVKDKDGRDIGKIDHFLIDDVEQKVRFIEIASGGFLGLGETKSFIPVEAITRITADDVYIGPTREHVAGAPHYDPDLVANVAGYFSGLYPYYGYEVGGTTGPSRRSWAIPTRSPTRPPPGDPATDPPRPIGRPSIPDGARTEGRGRKP